jgi:hypothetical protein
MLGSGCWMLDAGVHHWKQLTGVAFDALDEADSLRAACVGDGEIGSGFPSRIG